MKEAEREPVGVPSFLFFQKASLPKESEGEPVAGEEEADDCRGGEVEGAEEVAGAVLLMSLPSSFFDLSMDSSLLEEEEDLRTGAATSLLSAAAAAA